MWCNMYVSIRDPHKGVSLGCAIDYFFLMNDTLKMEGHSTKKRRYDMGENLIKDEEIQKFVFEAIQYDLEQNSNG